MKHLSFPPTMQAAMVFALLITAAGVGAQLAGPGTYDLSWQTIDGGGGTSSGGGFSLNGTIGQPDAGVFMTGGSLALAGGFWPGGGDPAPLCPADIAPAGAPNGTVNVDDLLAVINAWGVCANPSNCPADIAPAGGNDVVNVDDLLAVINAWGACP